MFFLFVPSKWKLRLLVLDCIILAFTLVQFANHFDALTKPQPQAQTENTTQNSASDAAQNNEVDISDEAVIKAFDEASQKIKDNTNE